VARSLTLAVISSSPPPLLLLDGEFAADMVRAVAYGWKAVIKRQRKS
jgi:hypothetical protein